MEISKGLIFDQQWEDLNKQDKCLNCGKSKSAKGFNGGCTCNEESQSVLVVDIGSK